MERAKKELTEPTKFQLPETPLTFTAVRADGSEIKYASLSSTAQMSLNRILNIYRLGINEILPAILNQLQSNSVNEVIEQLKSSTGGSSIGNMRISENAVVKTFLESIYQLMVSDAFQLIIAMLFCNTEENEFYFKREELLREDRLAEVLQVPRDIAIEAIMRFFYLTLSVETLKDSPTHSLTKRLLKQFLGKTMQKNIGDQSST